MLSSERGPSVGGHREAPAPHDARCGGALRAASTLWLPQRRHRRRLTNAAIGALGERPRRDNASGLRKPTCLHLRHSTVTPYSVRTNRPLVRTTASSGQHLSDIEYFRRYNRPRRPAFRPQPRSPWLGLFILTTRCLTGRRFRRRTLTRWPSPYPSTTDQICDSALRKAKGMCEAGA